MDGGFFFAWDAGTANKFGLLDVRGAPVMETAIKFFLVSGGMLGVAGVAWFISQKWEL